MQKHLDYLFQYIFFPGSDFAFGQSVKLPVQKNSLVVVAYCGPVAMTLAMQLIFGITVQEMGNGESSPAKKRSGLA